MGWRGLLRNLSHEAPQWASILPAIPRRLNEALSGDTQRLMLDGYIRLMREQRRQNWLLTVIALLLVGVLGAVALQQHPLQGGGSTPTVTARA